LQALPNREPADNEVIDNLLRALRGGVESERQRGDLMAFLARAEAAFGRIRGIKGKLIPQVDLALTACPLESTSLSPQSRFIDLEATGLYHTVIRFAQRVWPNSGIYGYGVPIRGGIYLPPKGTVRNHAYVEYENFRYGSHLHSSGKNARYGYVRGRQPVQVERVLSIQVPDHPLMRTICVIVRPFVRPDVEPDFPWSAWCVQLFSDVF
jgi:hypothetical protein